METNIRLFESSLLNDGSYGIGFDYIKNTKNMKIAFTGSSGSGKTTLVKFVEEEFGLKHISGSAGDILTEEDKSHLRSWFNYSGVEGHLGVIKKSATDVDFGISNQNLLQRRRMELIGKNDNFVTDRSPLDNFTYFISQVGFHPEVNDYIVNQFLGDCLMAWYSLTHVIFVRAVQPTAIENNGSRIANKYWQMASDAQFNYWLREIFLNYRFSGPNGEYPQPKLLVIDFWDLEKRKNKIREFLSEPRYEVHKPPTVYPTPFG